MKRCFLIVLTMMMALMGSAQEKNLSALFDYAVFNLPENDKPYVETYLDINAWSLNFVKESEGQYRATVEVTIVVRQNDTVAYLKKYNLHSPYTSSPEATNFTFFDMQRFALGAGIYDLELTISDKASQQSPAVINEKLVVYFPKDRPSMSRMLLISKASKTVEENVLSRGGYDMVPYISSFVPAEQKVLNPYFEIYNLDKELGNDSYLVYLYVEQQENGRRVQSTERLVRGKAANAKAAIYSEVDISKVPSGNYNLVTEIRNRKNETLLKGSVPFQRSNPQVQPDTLSAEDVATSFAGLLTDEQKLNYYIDALYPIASETEKDIANNLIKKPGLAEKQTFLYQFWMRRDPLDPAGKWHEYLGWLTYVDEHFSYPKTPGYRTDRGRVYLQYGPPDFIRDEKNFVGALKLGGGTNSQNKFSADQTAGPVTQTVANNSQGHVYYLPYQLWRYNRMAADEPNRVFLFWDEFRSGFYKLLNSNARGEVRDPLWERRLCQQQINEDVVGEVGEQFNRGY